MAKKNWQSIWSDYSPNLELDNSRMKQELKSIRWKEMRKIIIDNFGKVKGLESIEVGSGLGDFSILLNNEGVDTTLADYSEEAIAKAKIRFKMHGLRANYSLSDMLRLENKLKNRFDISFSLGVAEHFEHSDRYKIIKAHHDVLKKNGLTFISVPYRYSFIYRIWMRRCKKKGNWPYGLEIPFSKSELKKLAEGTGLETIGFIQSSFWGDFDNFFPRFRIGKVFPVKIGRVSIFDKFGYALIYVGKRS